jgi:hypothetical protein
MTDEGLKQVLQTAVLTFVLAFGWAISCNGPPPRKPTREIGDAAETARRALIDMEEDK